jgi:hypothetical protein
VGPHTATKWKEPRSPDPYSPFSSEKLTLQHVLCKEIEEKIQKSNMTKEVWKKEEEGAKMVVEYVKNIGLYYRL